MVEQFGLFKLTLLSVFWSLVFLFYKRVDGFEFSFTSDFYKPKHNVFYNLCIC